MVSTTEIRKVYETHHNDDVVTPPTTTTSSSPSSSRSLIAALAIIPHHRIMVNRQILNRTRRRRKQSKHSIKLKNESTSCIGVGGCLLSIVGWMTIHSYLLFANDRSDPHLSHRNSTNAKQTESRENFPEFVLDERDLLSDAYVIHQISSLRRSTIVENKKSESMKQFELESRNLRTQFAHQYGGETAARFMIQSALTLFEPSGGSVRNDVGLVLDKHDLRNISPSLQTTAARLLDARSNNRPFRISFGGYSVTAGRGNYFNQSYPFVLERLLMKPMAYLGIDLKVRNAAIGGAPSFPYGWCLNNFLGDDADLISWDFSMNEAGGVSHFLESYIRYGATMRQRPMMMFKDTTTRIADSRRKLIKSYVDMGVLEDPILLSPDDALEPLLSMREDLLPNGFRGWRDFGAPKGSPGQTSHHPGTKEHEFLGWLLCMHFLAALEIAAFVLTVDGTATDERIGPRYVNYKSLPRPVHSGGEMQSLYYGWDTGSGEALSWRMNPVHCATSYEPIMEDRNYQLGDLIISGSTGEDMDIMLPKGAQQYNNGWVLDLGRAEKTAKRRLERFAGLGFIDSKKAYYGIYGSGPLKLFVPCKERDDILRKTRERVPAKDCFVQLVVCEANEKRSGDVECNLNSDLSFRIGGLGVPTVTPMEGTQYWGRNVCVGLSIPEGAVMSVVEENGSERVRPGVSVIIEVSNGNIGIHSGPCSVSHVIWEQTEPGEISNQP